MDLKRHQMLTPETAVNRSMPRDFFCVLDWPDQYADSIYSAYRGTWSNMYQEDENVKRVTNLAPLLDKLIESGMWISKELRSNILNLADEKDE